MGIIGHIQKGFETALKSPLIVGLVFAYGFVWSLINIPFMQAQEGATDVGSSIASGILTILFLLTSIYMQAGLLTYVRERMKKGQASFADFSAGGSKYYWRVLGLSVILMLFVIILLILSTLAILFAGEGVNVFSLIVVFILATIGLTGLFFLFLAPYTIVADDEKVIRSMKTSVAIVKSHFIQLALLGTLLILIYLGVFALITTVASVTGLASIQYSIPGQVVAGAVSSFVHAVWGVLLAGVFMSFYLSARHTAPAA